MGSVTDQHTYGNDTALVNRSNGQSLLPWGRHFRLADHRAAACGCWCHTWKTDWQHKSETKVGKKNKTNLTSYVSPLCCLTQLHAKPSCERHQLMRISLPCKISKPTMMYYVENKTVRTLVGCSQTLRRPASGLWRASSNCLITGPIAQDSPRLQIAFIWVLVLVSAMSPLDRGPVSTCTAAPNMKARSM